MSLKCPLPCCPSTGCPFFEALLEVTDYCTSHKTPQALPDVLEIFWPSQAYVVITIWLLSGWLTFLLTLSFNKHHQTFFLHLYSSYNCHGWSVYMHLLCSKRILAVGPTFTTQRLIMQCKGLRLWEDFLHIFQVKSLLLYFRLEETILWDNLTPFQEVHYIEAVDTARWMLNQKLFKF